MALLAAQAVTLTGLNPSFAAAANTDTIKADGRTTLWVKNGAGAPINVTVVTPKTDNGLAVADLVVAVPAGEQRLIGPFGRDLFADPNGQAGIDYSSVTTITVAALVL